MLLNLCQEVAIDIIWPTEVLLVSVRLDSIDCHWPQGDDWIEALLTADTLVSEGVTFLINLKADVFVSCVIDGGYFPSGDEVEAITIGLVRSYSITPAVLLLNEKYLFLLSFFHTLEPAQVSGVVFEEVNFGYRVI
jgi:hypothetical protein